ncbi:DUF1507 family protein [Atopobacter sp. AH10]|uniref:DUF1507 family protein n=1 Tax=Atopobacter sp. AH10 TaxID=2315861 RepID=UPI001F43CD6C|nr:DUF1507 family protein [Atopobacter sp. AH10]
MTEKAWQILNENADIIYQLIERQKNYLCLTQCPAVEEVIDTQLFGLTKQVEFAIAIDAISEEEGHALISRLESRLNDVYSVIYDQHYEGFRS